MSVRWLGKSTRLSGGGGVGIFTRFDLYSNNVLNVYYIGPSLSGDFTLSRKCP